MSYSWAYDRYGNRSSATPGANISINKANNIISTAGFVSDAAGNMTGDGVHTYSYDAEFNLVSVDNGSTATYTYDALNRRVRIDNTQGSHEFTYDFAGRRVGTWDANTNTGIQGQIWWGGLPLAYRDSDGSTYFEQGDWEGTQRVLTNYAGSVTSLYTSRPWGEAYTTSGKDDNISHYAGLEQSENTGILHAQFRDYDSSLGRWMSPDSYTGSYDFTNPQSFNRFNYTMGDPVSETDPSGQVRTPWGDYADPGFGGGFGSNWDEFALLETPVYEGLGFGYISTNQPLGGFAFSGGYATTSITAFGWGVPQFGTGFDLLGLIQPPTSVNLPPTPVCYQGGCIVPGGPPLITKQQIKRAVKTYLCGSSPADNVKNWTAEGTAKGLVFGGLTGGITGTVVGTPVGGAIGAVAGGVIDGAIGGATGVIWGSIASWACYAAGAY